MSTINNYGWLPPFLTPFYGDAGAGGRVGLVPAPAAGDAAAGKFLDASGGWSIPSGTGGGVTTVGTIDSQTPSANGAVISGTTIYFQSASSSAPGLLTALSQTIAGQKTFSSFVTISPNTNQLVLGTTNTTTLTMASLSASRVVTFPDANSNTIIPTTATASQWVTNVTSGGVQTKAQPAFSDISGTLNLATQVTGILPVANGGTALSTTPTNGQLLIGNGTNYTLATLTAGSGVTISNGSGSITISADGTALVTTITGTANQVLANGSTSPQSGAVTLTLPQSIATTSGVQFNALGLGTSSPATTGQIQTTGISKFGSSSAFTTIASHEFVWVSAVGSFIDVYLSGSISNTSAGGANAALEIQSSLTKGSGSWTTADGILNNPTFSIGTNLTSGCVFRSIATLSSGSGLTVSSLFGFQAQTPSAGGFTGTLTNHYGFYSEALAVGTNRYGARLLAPTGGTIAITAYVDNLSVGYNVTPPSSGAIISGSVAIGSSSATASAILALTSTTQGFLPCAMTTNQKNAIVSPASGLVVYDNTLNDLQFYNGSAWVGASLSGVTSITGTANQVIASAATGAVTLSLPQSIATSSAVQFGTLALGSAILTSAIMSLTSTTLGFLPPRMTTTQKNAISSTAAGLVVYDSTLNDLQFYNGSAWVGSSLSGVTSAAGTANQVLVNGTSGSAQTGDITLTLPQSIATNSTVQFGLFSVGSAATANTRTTISPQSTDKYGFLVSGTLSANDGSNTIGIFNNTTLNPTANNINCYGGYNGPMVNVSSTNTIPVASGYDFTLGGSAGSGAITFGFTGRFFNPTIGTTKVALYSDNISIGYTNTPPSNGLLVSGQTIFKATSSFISASVEIQGSDRISLGIAGTKTPTDGSVQTLVYMGATFSPVSSTTVCSNMILFPTFSPPTGVTITSAANLYLQAGTQGGLGSVTTGYGIFVDNPGFGTTKIAAWLNGSVTINTGTVDGASKLTVAGSISVPSTRSDGFNYIGINETVNAGIMRLVSANVLDVATSALQLIHIRGSVASKSANLQGDILGAIDFGGYATGSDYTSTSSVILSIASANWDATQSPSDLVFLTNPIGSLSINHEVLRLSADGNVVCGANNGAALATTATNGFIYIPYCAGAPTGSATTYTGRDAMVVDDTNFKIYVRFSNNTWKSVTLT